jgi:hypothetical protein
MDFLFIRILLLHLFDLILQSSFCFICLIILAFNLFFKMNHTPLQWIFGTHALVTRIVVSYNIFFNTICPHVYSLDLSFLKHCVQVKMTQLLFSSYSSTTIFPIEIVHSDVLGLNLITSINSTCYFVIFVDDCTHFIFLFFSLSHKSQVLSFFMHLKNTTENLLNTLIKILRMNCYGEYKKREFTSLFLIRALFINSLALTLLNKMGLHNAIIAILLIFLLP